VLPVAVLSLPFLFILVRRPILRRLALRNLVRRPREAALVVLGSMFGTAIITGSLVVGDTIDASIRSLAHTRLGPIDEVIATPDRDTARRVEAEATAEARRNPAVDGVLGMGRLEVTAAAGEGDARRAAPRAALLELDFADAAALGHDPGITGMEGPTPPRGRAVLTEPLADLLRVGRGDTVTAFVFGRAVPFTVERTLGAKGLAGFTTGFFDQPSYNLLVAPGTLDDVTRLAGDALGSRYSPPDWIVAVSNRGGVEDGAEPTAAVTSRLEERLDGLGVRIVPVKQDILEEAEEDADSFRELFGAMGAFGILAGVLLLVNIFVMLGEERKPELGMLRAVGLRRASLVGAFSTEGWAYAVAAAGVGTFVGLGLGRVIIEGVRRVMDNDVQGFGIPLRFAADLASLRSGFVAGFVIALVAIVATSVRIARFNVIMAIRELPEPRRVRARLRWVVVGAALVVLGGAATASSFGDNAEAPRLIGPVLLVLGLGLLLDRWFSRRRLVTGVSLAAIAWAAAVFPITTELGDAGIELFVVQGITLTAAAVVLVTQEHDRFERLARRLGVGRMAMAARLGLAYPVARRFRTGLTLAMYSLVIFTLTFITVLAGTFRNQIDQTTKEISGGYDVFVRSNPSNPVPFDDLAAVEGVEYVAPLASVEVNVEAPGATETDWGMVGFDERFIERAPALDDRGRYPSDRAAYEAVLADPDLILADRFFLSEGGGPPSRTVRVGDRIRIADPLSGRARTVTVVAQSADDFLFNGAFYGIDGLRELYGPRAVPNRAYVTVAGADAVDVAAVITGRYVRQGAEADTIRQVLSDFISVQNQFFRIFQGYLGLGLLVGVAGLGVVMVRAVRERRREIGVLRALGFQSRTVRRSFVLESAFVALEGTVIGVSLALVTAFNVMSNTEAFGEGTTFTVPGGELLVLVAATLAVSLLATAGPTRAAARIRPAVALRIAD
jgi:putative ABC transport system permease protein